MKSDSKVLDYLKKLITYELTSINQYFLHARMFKNWGLDSLNDKEYKKSILDMKQADDLIKRVFFLESLPNLQDLNKLMIGESTEEILQCDLDLQSGELMLLKEAINYCEIAQDYVSRELLEKVLEGEEEHVDWIETQQGLIKKVGIKNYQQSMM